MLPRRPLTAAALAAALAATPASPAAASSPAPWTDLMDRDAVGARAFTDAHPEWDGRGVVVAVLDTGVDPSVPGLLKTSTGETKLIEARDFSGEGDIALTQARVVIEGGAQALRTDDGVVTGHDALGAAPADAVWWLGFVDEKDLVNSEVNDLDRDGRSASRFAVVAFRPTAGGDPVMAFDLDGDGSLAGEAVRKSYRQEPTWFQFAHPDPRADQTPVALTATAVFDVPGEAPKVELHFDDGGHGTHCAGIAAGHRLEGRDGFDGIAPGAYVMSLKIGHNALAGGATTPGSKQAAIEYARRFAQETGMPVVMNISYGIGSSLEGDGAIDAVLDRELLKEPHFAASVSAGNAGPGLSTVGMPAGSDLAYTAGAALPADNAKTLYGGSLDGTRVWFFSSRGGELAKPDGITPGVAWSSVPPFLHRSVMAGTSMAAPQAAGVHALLMSAAEQAKVRWSGASVKQALLATAKPLRGYTYLDQGAGMLQVPEAWRALRRLGAAKDPAVLAGLDVETPVAHAPGQDGSASFWRVGGFVPDDEDPVTVSITPKFYATATESQRTAWFETIGIDVEGRWVDADRGRLGLKGATGGAFKLRLDPEGTKGAGLHVATVALVEGRSRLPLATLPVARVVPHRFGSQGTRSREFTGTMGPGDAARVFVEVPPGATSMEVRLDVPEGERGAPLCDVYRPDGTSLAMLRATSKDRNVARYVASGDALVPGTWELTPWTSQRSVSKSAYRLRVAFHGIDAPASASYSAPEAGGLASSWTLTNRFGAPFVGGVAAKRVGRQRSKDVAIEGASATVPLTVAAGTESVDLHMHLDAATYAQFTDVAVTVLDGGGKAVVQTGFNGVDLHEELHLPPGSYTLEILGGQATEDDAQAWTVAMVERHLSAGGELKIGGPAVARGRLTLHPGVPTPLSLSGGGALPELPDGFEHVVRLTLDEPGSGERWLDAYVPLSK